MRRAKWLTLLAMLSTGVLFQPFSCTWGAYAATGMLLSALFSIAT